LLARLYSPSEINFQGSTDNYGASQKKIVPGTVMIHSNATPPNSEYIHGSTGKNIYALLSVVLHALI
jgi:hypothetical protein